MKKLIYFLFFLVFLFTIFSCGKNDVIDKTDIKPLVKIISHSGKNVAVKIKKLHSGEFIIAGNDYTQSNYPGFVFLIDRSFNILWWKNFDMLVSDAEIDKDDNIIIAGKTSKGAYGYNRPAVKKMDTNGNIILEKILLKQQVPAGNINDVSIVSGQKLLFGGVNYSGIHTGFIVKTDMDFNIDKSNENNWPVIVDEFHTSGYNNEVTSVCEMVDYSNKLSYVAAGNLTSQSSYGNKVWLLQLNINGKFIRKGNFDFGQNNQYRFDKIIDVGKLLLVLGSVDSTNNNGTPECWTSYYEKQQLKFVGFGQKGNEGFISKGNDVSKYDDSSYYIVGYNQKEYPTGWFMKWSSRSLKRVKKIGFPDSTLTYLKGVAPDGDSLLIVGNKSTVGISEAENTDSIFILKTDLNGNFNVRFE